MLIFDVETNAKDPEQVTRVWCVCTIDTTTGEERAFTQRQIPQALEYLAAADRLAGHNILRYDLPVLQRLFGFQPPGDLVVDTLVLSRLVANGLSEGGDQFGRHGLQAWGQRLGCLKGEFKAFDRFSTEMVQYCQQDCRVVAKLLEWFRQQEPSGAACNLELRYEAYLRQIERHGFTFDATGCGRLAQRLQRRRESLQHKIDRIFPPQQIVGTRPSYYTWQPSAGTLFDALGEIPQFPTKAAAEAWRKQRRIKPRDLMLVEGPPEVKIKRFNPASPQDVIDGLQSLGWEPQRETETGRPKAGEEDLWHSGLAAGKLIAAARGYGKLLSFCDQWIRHERGGKLFPSFTGNYTITNRSTGRAPNVQQIPSGKERTSGMNLLQPYGARCRSLFSAQSGYVLVGADLAGIEARLLGHFLTPFDGGAFGHAVCSGEDIHDANAKRIGISRAEAKTVLYASLYGAGAPSLSMRLKVPYQRAKAIIQALTTGIPGFTDLLEALRTEASRTGRITCIDGRRLQCSSEHKLLNYAISGSAAVLFKHWVLRAAKQLEGTSYRLLTVVHDEVQSECLPDDADRVTETLKRTAAEAGELLGFSVPIAADAKVGRNWSETH